MMTIQFRRQKAEMLRTYIQIEVGAVAAGASREKLSSLLNDYQETLFPYATKKKHSEDEGKKLFEWFEKQGPFTFEVKEGSKSHARVRNPGRKG